MSVPSDTDQTEYWQDRLEHYLERYRVRGRSNSQIDENKSILKPWIRHVLSQGMDPGIFDQAQVDRLLRNRNPNLAESSRHAYTSHIRRWCKYWQTQDTKSVPWDTPEGEQGEGEHDDEAEIWQDRLEEYLEHLRTLGRKPDTINHHRNALARWISYALSQGASPERFERTAIDRYLDDLNLEEISRPTYASHIRLWCEYWQSQDTESGAWNVSEGPGKEQHDDEAELWQERLEDYLNFLRTRGRSSGTIDNNRSVLHRWIDHARSQGASPEVFDEAAIDRYLDDQNLGESSRLQYPSYIRSWCQYRQAQDASFNAWVVRAGRDGEMEQHNLDHSVITVGWGAAGEILDSLVSREDYNEYFTEVHPGWGSSAMHQIWRFGRDIQVDDYVVMPQKRSPLLAIARVVGPYQYDPSRPENVRHRREVEWLRTDLPREVVREDLNKSLGNRLTVSLLNRNDAPYRIQYLAAHGVDPGDRNSGVDTASPREDTRSLEERLEKTAGKLLCEPRYLKEIVDLLEDKGQVILYGPPGTGKTYLAQALAEALAPEQQARSLVQFHPAYTYEDFFEGYRPVTGDDKQMTYELTPGPLAKLAEHASDHPEQQHVMVIDEINRANLPRVLGELLFLLEYRDRSMAVMHRSDGSFKLPENLWFIGTMNTADRSIALIDAAMRRRFHFVPFFPEREPTKSLLRKWTNQEAPAQAWVVDLVSAVNSELEKELGGDHLQLGPSHFMKPDLNEGGFERVWRYNIEPFIEDQLFGKPEKIKRFRLDAVLRRHGRSEFALQEGDLADDFEPTSAPTKPDRSTVGRQNNDAMVPGQEIYDDYQADNRTYTWMGRQSGISGQPLRDDLDSGAWRSREYEVRYESISGNRNWFPIQDFIALVDELVGPDGDEAVAGGE